MTAYGRIKGWVGVYKLQGYTGEDVNGLWQLIACDDCRLRLFVEHVVSIFVLVVESSLHVHPQRSLTRLRCG
jgi:hypothetical protein